MNGSRPTTSSTAIGRRARTASARMLRAISGRKWWKLLKSVRTPESRAGTAVASTGSST
jgi:hypothetical protein